MAKMNAFLFVVISLSVSCAIGMFSGQQSGEIPLLAAALSLIDHDIPVSVPDIPVSDIPVSVPASISSEVLPQQIPSHFTAPNACQSQSFRTQIYRQNAHLNQFGLARRAVRGDGNCLFRAISYGLLQSEDFHGDLRQSAVNFMQSNMVYFRTMFEEPGTDFQHELQTLAQDGSYAGQECIIALARALNINIRVTYGGDDNDNRVITMDHSPNNDPSSAELTIHIAYSSLGGGHYDAVVESTDHAYDIPDILNKNSAKTTKLDFKETEHSRFSNSMTLDVHVEEEQKPNSDVKQNPSLNSLQCQICDKKFSSKSVLKRHLLNKHKDQVNLESKPRGTYNKCLVPSCTKTFRTVQDSLDHLEKDHSAQLVRTQLIFENIKEFEAWKEREEINNNVYFAKSRKESIGANGKICMQFVCNRDGCKRITSNSKTSCNVKGSCKINNLCPSRMYVKIKGELVEVEYIQTHTHSIEFDQGKFLRIPHSVGEDISQKLSLNIPVEDILNTLRGNIGNIENRNVDNIKFFQLVNRKNLVQLKRRLTEFKFKKHSDDSTSTMLWVEYLRNLEDNPVLVYKQTGIHDPSLPIAKEDFLLILMSKEQTEMFKEFGPRILCIDSTHSTTAYDMKLVTLLVVDEFRRGYPVAFCISSKEDTNVLTILLKAVQEKCPLTCISRVMTDDDCSAINAVKSVYGSDVKHYLCIWHVHQAWKRKLVSITNKNHKLEIYFFLCSMLNTKSQSEFQLLKDRFITKYSALEPGFIEYFEKNYMYRSEKWALCMRDQDLQTEITTNMFIESFHNNLKTNYMGRKQNKRVDKLLYILLEMEKHYFLSRFKNVQYSDTSNTNEPSNQHKAGIAISDNNVITLSENRFSVVSQSSSGTSYIITRYSNSCNFQSCFKRCNTIPCVNLCSHMYSCNCPDSNPLCKHIHKIHSLSHVPDEDDCETEIELSHSNLVTNTDEHKIKTLLQRYEKAKTTLDHQVKTSEIKPLALENIVLQLEKLVKVSEATLHMELPSKLKQTKQVSSNKNFIKQPSFKKTVKRKNKKVLRAPTDKERDNLLTEQSEEIETGSSNGPSVAPYPLVPMGQESLSSVINRNAINNENEVDSSSFVSSTGAISVPSNYLIPPSMNNRPVTIVLPNGKHMKIIPTIQQPNNMNDEDNDSYK